MELEIGMVYKVKQYKEDLTNEHWAYFRVEKKIEMIDGVWYDVTFLYPKQGKYSLKESWCTYRNTFESTLGEIAIEILDSERETG